MSLRVLAVSVAPLFRGAVHGGSQRVLVEVAHALAGAGHSVRIACGARPENEGGFELTSRAGAARDTGGGSPGGTGAVTVEPVLGLRGFFPDPYEVPPHRLAATARALTPLIDWADRVYLHADIFHFRSLVPPGVPVIRSFHDFHYETALVSAFAYGADVTIVPSGYLRRCIEATVGRSGLRALEPIEVVPNGIDLDAYRPGPGGQVSPVVRGRDLTLLHPHRPDPRKGIDQALQVVAELRRRAATGLTATGPAPGSDPSARVRLVVPRHIDAASDPAVAAYYEDVRRRAVELGVPDALEFPAWAGDRDMPALYRSADVTLCPGNFIESFGLTAYESLGCGTPVVAARVGALREAPGFADLYRVEYGDIGAAADAVLNARGGMRDMAGARRLLEAGFSLAGMTGGYVRLIENARARRQGARPSAGPGPAAGPTRRSPAAGLRSGPVPRPGGPGDMGVRYELAPWCHVAGDRVYNDYAYRHLELPRLARALASGPGEVDGSRRVTAVTGSGVPKAEMEEALRTGVLVPVGPATAQDGERAG